MMSFRLWQRLHDPPAIHAPLYQLARRPYRYKLMPPLFNRNVGCLALIFALWYVMWPVMLLGLLAGPVLVPLIINGRALMWSMQAARTVSEAQTSGIYPVLAALPGGQWQFNWTAVIAAVHSDRTFPRLSRADMWATRVLWMGLAFIAAPFFQSNFSPTATYGTGWLAAFVSLVVATYFDQTQAVVVGALVGMLAPTEAYGIAGTQVWTFTVYMLLTGSAYLGSAIIGLWVLPMLLGGMWGAALAPGVAGGLFVAAREATVRGLWRLLEERFSATDAPR